MPKKPKPMTVVDAYNKAKPKSKSSARENVTRSGQGSGNTAAPRRAKLSGELPSAIKRRNALGDKREKVTRTGQGSGNTGPKKKNKGFFDRVGDIAKGVGRVGEAVVKDSINTVTNPFGAAKSTAQQIGRDVKNKNVGGLALTALGTVPLPAGRGLSAAAKAAGKAGKAGKTLAELAEAAAKSSSKTKKAVSAGVKIAKNETPAVAKKLDDLTKIGGDKAGVAKRLREATPRVKKEIARDNVPQVLPVKRVSQSATAAEKKILSKGKSATAKPTVNRTGYVPPAKVKSSPWDKNIAMSMKYNLPEEVKPVRAAKRQGPKVNTTPKAGSVPKKKPAKSVAATAKTADVSEGALAQKRVADARANLNAFKAQHGASYRTKRGYTKLANAVTRAEQGVNTSRRIGAPRPQRGVTQTTMTNTRVNAGDAQRTYSRIGRSKTPRNGMTESPKPSKGQYEGDLLRGQARDDAARMSNRGLRGSKRATRDGRTAENKAKNVQNIAIRENNRKVAKYEEMRQKAIQSKKPKDIEAAKKYAEFWGLKGIKRLK